MFSKKIRTVLLERDMTIRQLSDKIGYKGSHLYTLLEKDNFNEKQLLKIADALDCDFDGGFVLRDTGKKI
jgi:predicted transcriptional regulator